MNRKTIDYVCFNKDCENNKKGFCYLNGMIPSSGCIDGITKSGLDLKIENMNHRIKDLEEENKQISQLQDSLREANECLSQIYSHLGVEAFGKDIQEQAVKEIDRLMDLEQELAELKQKAIVPKFRTYQPIFYITQYYTSTKGNPEYDIISDMYYVAENENEIILGWNYAKDFNQRKYYYVRKDWVFATKEEAEQRLAKIKGE